jgi:hypothetical protein
MAVATLGFISVIRTPTAAPPISLLLVRQFGSARWWAS